MLRYIGSILLLCAVLALAADAASGAPSAPSVTCYEDQPCWHWPTMGNGMRGIVTLDGDPIVVGACRFARAMAGHTRAQRRIMGWGMRGDRWAMRHGCEGSAHA